MVTKLGQYKEGSQKNLYFFSFFGKYPDTKICFGQNYWPMNSGR